MIIFGVDLDAAGVGKLVEPFQERLLGHLRKVIRHEKAKDAQPILDRIGKRQLIRSLAVFIIRVYRVQCGHLLALIAMTALGGNG